MREAIKKDYFVNYTDLLSKNKEIDDNSGLMMLRLLIELDVEKVYIAGMDGYNSNNLNVYVNDNLFYDFSNEADYRNDLIKNDLNEIKKNIHIEFLTPSIYSE